MTKLIDNIIVVLCALMLSTNLMFAGSVESSLEDEQITLGGVTLACSVRDLTEVSAVFYGKVVLEDDYSANSFGILYSTEPNITVSTATNLSIRVGYGGEFSTSVASLIPETTYYYATYIKHGPLYKYSEVKSFATQRLSPPVLNDASNVTEVSATIDYQIPRFLGKASDLEFGLQLTRNISFSSGVSTSKNTEIAPRTVGYTEYFWSLLPETEYYYRTYIKMNGVYGYSDVKLFTTKGVSAPVLDAASELTRESAKISGMVFPVSGKSSDLEYGFQYSPNETFSSSVTTEMITAIDSDNRFSMSISYLDSETVYYYRSYIKINRFIVYGEVNSFTTLRDSNEKKDNGLTQDDLY